MMICIICFEGGVTHLNPQLFCICRLQKACFQCRAGYQEETIKGKERAFKLGPFDCVTDWFQVRQLWEPQPEENCPSVQRSWEAGRLHGWHGAPEFQYYSRLVGFLWDLCWASRILLWLIAATLKAKSGQRRRGRRVSGLLNSCNYQHDVRDLPLIPSEDTSWSWFSKQTFSSSSFVLKGFFFVFFVSEGGFAALFFLHTFFSGDLIGNGDVRPLLERSFHHVQERPCGVKCSQ